MSTIIFLEGISKSGKTSWYERNEALLRENWKHGVKYYHPHQSEEGQRLKLAWIENESTKPAQENLHKDRDSLIRYESLWREYRLRVIQIAWQYVGLHFSTQEQIFHDVKKNGADLVVLDRTLLTALSINFNNCFPVIQDESEIFPHPLHHLMIDYFRRFRVVFNTRKMLFFDCWRPMERYKVMQEQGVNHSYRRHLSKMPSGHTIFDKILIFADNPIDMVDKNIKSQLNLVNLTSAKTSAETSVEN